MATIFSRMKKLGLDFTTDKLSQIGMEIAKDYFTVPERPALQRVKSNENGIEYMVLSYPKSYIPRVDAILQSHKPTKTKRPRIGQKPIQSSDI